MVACGVEENRIWVKECKRMNDLTNESINQFKMSLAKLVMYHTHTHTHTIYKK